MTVFDTLLARIMPILQQIEAERKKHHNESFLWIDFVRVLMFYFTKRCGSRNALIVALENAAPALAVPPVPAMTLSDAFRRFPPSLLRVEDLFELLDATLVQFGSPLGDLLADLRRFDLALDLIQLIVS
jgi:hypothetical protein